MGKPRFNFDALKHPVLYNADSEAIRLFQEQSPEDICEALANLLGQFQSLRKSYSAACAAAEIFQGKMETWKKEAEIKSTELSALVKILEEREEELSKLTGGSLINCKCQVILPHDCKLKQA